MLTALLLAFGQAPPPVEIIASFDGMSCHIAFDDRAQPLPFHERALVDAFRDLKRQGRTIAFRFDMKLPYRCIGMIIYTAQRAGVRMRMGFVSEPPPPAGEGP